LGLTPVIGICYLFLNGFGAMVIIGFALLPMAVLLICLGRRRRQKGSVECC
jgi:multisubunit Na+/H+ antiporter MnhC subunit